MNFLRELRRRRVLRTASIYVVGAWLLMQVADIVFPVLEVPETAMRNLLYALTTGFPLALIVGAKRGKRIWWMTHIVGPGELLEAQQEIVDAVIAEIAPSVVERVATSHGTER